MDSVVEKIAREVMLKLKSESADRGSTYTPSTSSFSPVSTSSSRVQGGVTAVLLTTNFKVIDQVLDQIGAVLPASGKLIVSSYLYNNYGQEKIGGNVTLLHSGNVPAFRVFEGVSNLIIPSFSLNTLSKAANLISDTYATQVLSLALCEGMKITVTDESIIDASRYFTAGIAKKIASFRRDLEEMGVVFRRDTAMKITPSPMCASGTCDVGASSKVGTSSPITPMSSRASSSPKATSFDKPTVDCTLSYGSCVTSCANKVKEVILAGAERVEKGLDEPIPSKELAKYIDHTLLKANATEAEITKLCDEAREYKFASVCINPANVALSARLLKGTGVAICTVIGFPLGATSTFVKVMETRDAIANGATEIDMVINVGALKSKDYELLKNDIARVVEAANGHIVKVIFETALLTDEEKVKACELSKQAGADFVKTSTGFSSGGATMEDVCLMRSTVGSSMGVKASGGVRDTKTAQQMIAIGATRIGASASIAIVKGTADDGKGY